jgi:hypothetical protein
MPCIGINSKFFYQFMHRSLEVEGDHPQSPQNLYFFLILHIPTTTGPGSSYRALKARAHIPEYASAVQR